MVENYKTKMAIISGASHALEIKEKNPKATNEEIIKKITERVNEILSKIEGEDFN